MGEQDEASVTGWHRGRGDRPPGRSRGLSQRDIVAAAVALADAEGTDAVSIRRIARDLRVGAMSLYWHVSSTDELHRLMLEAVQAETEVPEPSGDWRADLRAYAHSTRAALLRHPWASDFLAAGPPAGPADAANADRLLAILAGPGHDLRTDVWAAMTVWTYVLGAALREIQEIRWHRAQAEREAGMSAAEIAAEHDEFAHRIGGTGRYPNLGRLVEAGLDPDAPETRDERFEFGLTCVLDGIAANAGPPRAS
ncbi:MAG TPA: TetR/AcrR family transcriptional regulator C-terminal domain-containing protein [Trebonia sp.]|nr:TetR/AcrR family transcriptional regulator C-terminal domain-containing protein [Trebonia sp.]